MQASYNDYKIDKELEEKIQTKFNSFNNGGITSIMNPSRVDILQKI